MTLHGDLRVNHRKIGEWWATRQPGTVDVHHYRWAVRVDGADWMYGELAHREADGAAVLAGKVLAASRAVPDADGLTEDEVAYAIAGAYGESCGWGANRGRECGMCDYLGMTEACARSAARAVLAIATPRLAAAEVAAEGYRQRAERAEDYRQRASRAASARDALIIMLGNVRETAEHYDGRTDVDAAAAILRVLDGAS